MYNDNIDILRGKTFVIQMLPVMCCFFVMGFVDLVGIASNYVQEDFRLSDFQANSLASLVFVWFLVCPVPTAMLMNRVGRKATVIASLALTLVSLTIPVWHSGFGAMLAAFSLLGISNAMLQTSLNPLVSGLVEPHKFAATLSLGQCVKAVASFAAPYLLMWGAAGILGDYDLGWRVIFPVYAMVCLMSLSMLGITPIPNSTPELKGGVVSTFRLLLKLPVFYCFMGIVCHVGIDVGTNTIAPRILRERLGMGMDEAAIATAVYFIFRTIGCLAGSWMLARPGAGRFFRAGVVMMSVGLLLLIWAPTAFIIYACIGAVGYGNSNVFPVLFARGMETVAGRRNELSALMITALAGGALFPLLMSVGTHWDGTQRGALAVMCLGSLFLLCLALRKQ